MNRILVLTVLAAAVALGVSGTAAEATPHAGVISVATGPITAANSHYLDVPPTGASLDDTRTYFLPITHPGSSTAIGYMTGTTTTVAVDEPSAGMELRTANLVFVIGAAANQIVVGGVGIYPAGAPALAVKSVTVRPVIGGSGVYAGARGWCVTTHLANDTWTHVFHVTLS